MSGRLRNSMKDLINIKNNDNKCFRRCHIRHLNLLKIHAEQLSKADKNMVNDLDYGEIDSPVSRRHFGKIVMKNNIYINLFCFVFVFPVYISNKKLEIRKIRNGIDLLFIADENEWHYVYIKDLNRFMSNRAKKTKIKITFAGTVYNVLVVKAFW